MRFVPSFIALSLLSTPIFASDDWFEIELVVFDRHGQTSQELWAHDAPSIDTSKAIDLEMAHLMPTYPECPQLEQTEIEQILASEQATQVLAGQQQVDTDPPASDQLEQEIVKCIIALPEAVAELAEQSENDNEPTPLSLSEPETENNSEYAALIKRPQVDSTLEPLSLEQQVPPLALPTTFTYQQLNYQVVEPSEVLQKIPVRVNAESLAQQLVAPHLLDQDSLQLTELVKKLRWQKQLTPKLHIGWRQHVEARHLAKPVRLFAGQNFSERYHQDGSKIVTIMPQDEDQQALTQRQEQLDPIDLIEQATAVASEQPAANIWEIDGLFKVYLNRYLFIETSLNRKIPTMVRMMLPVDYDSVEPQQQTTAGLLEKNGSSQSGADDDSAGISLVKTPNKATIKNDGMASETVETSVPWLVNHTLTQHRRVRSKEIHYFDHPSLGIIVQIRRFTLETPTPQTEQ